MVVSIVGLYCGQTGGASDVAALLLPVLLGVGMILGASAALCQFVIGIFDEARL